MPTSARGSELRAAAARGFTLIELLVVVAIIAATTALVTLALRDGDADRLERDAQRLATLLEAARAESRASGLPVWWRPSPDADVPGFRFVGLPDTADGRPALPRDWLDPAVRAVVVGRPQGSLGPDALIGAQRIVLQLERQRLELATDGLAPFAIVATDEAGS